MIAGHEQQQRGLRIAESQGAVQVIRNRRPRRGGGGDYAPVQERMIGPRPHLRRQEHDQNTEKDKRADGIA